MTEPPITLRAAHDSGPGNDPVTRVVIHATCPNVGYADASAPGAAHGTALYFQQPATPGSAHYVAGVDGEEHCVPDDVIAWHAPPNPHSLGIEITSEGGDYPKNYTREQWLSPQVWPAVQRAAARARDLCQRHGVPMVKLSSADLLAGAHGICGHVDVSQAWRQSTHSDPGPNFPWDRFMAAVNGSTPHQPTGFPEDEDMRTYSTVDTKRGYVASGDDFWYEWDPETYDSYTAASGQQPLQINQRQADVIGARMAMRRAGLVADVAKACGGQVDPQALATALAPALVAGLAGKTGGLTETDVETAIRAVLGSLDNPPTPAAQ